MNEKLKIDPYGFREYDARWIYEKDINSIGITNLGKGLGSQIKIHTKKNNPRIIVGHDYRSYSEDIKIALKKGLISTGCFPESFVTSCFLFILAPVLKVIYIVNKMLDFSSFFLVSN